MCQLTKKLYGYVFLNIWETNLNHPSIFLFSYLELKPVGILEVKLIQAMELTNKDLIGKSDPFAKLFIRPVRSKMQTSKTIVR